MGTLNLWEAFDTFSSTWMNPTCAAAGSWACSQRARSVDQTVEAEHNFSLACYSTAAVCTTCVTVTWTPRINSQWAGKAQSPPRVLWVAVQPCAKWWNSSSVISNNEHIHAICSRPIRSELMHAIIYSLSKHFCKLMSVTCSVTFQPASVSKVLFCIDYLFFFFLKTWRDDVPLQ